MERPKITTRAHDDIRFAIDEAARLHHRWTGTGHLLLAITREDGCVSMMLWNRGVDRGMIDREVAIVMAQMHEQPGDEDCLFTANALMALDLAVEEAVRLDHGFVGPEHFLLGLSGELEGVAASALISLGVSYLEIRRELLRLLGG